MTPTISSALKFCASVALTIFLSAPLNALLRFEDRAERLISGTTKKKFRERFLVENSKDSARARADLRFKKQEEAVTAREKAMAEYTAETNARQAKTDRLRALRLAKEAEDLANAPAAPVKKPARAKKKVA